jgi:hypothetical protein
VENQCLQLLVSILDPEIIRKINSNLAEDTLLLEIPKSKQKNKTKKIYKKPKNISGRARSAQKVPEVPKSADRAKTRHRYTIFKIKTKNKKK